MRLAPRVYTLASTARMKGEAQLGVQALYPDSALEVGDFRGAFDVLLKIGEGHLPDKHN